jgi:uncharacterized repeat protein (TIGR01451 family)
LFITYEFTNVIQIVNATTLTEPGTTTAIGASNLAGIVFDENNGLLYTVDWSTNRLYVYAWDPATLTLTLQFGGPKVLPNLSDAFGLALDMINNRLYVADNGPHQVEIYDTATWGTIGTIQLNHYAIGIAVDPVNDFVYTSAGWMSTSSVYSGVWQYDMATGSEIRNTLSGIGVMGLAVDTTTSYVYGTTGYSGDDLIVLDPTLTLQNTYDLATLTSPYTDSNGQTYTYTPSPSGICIPGGGVSYNPLNLGKSDSTDPVNVGDTLTYTLTYDNTINAYDVTGVTIVDDLPDEVTFVSSATGVYNAIDHTVTWNIGTVLAGAGQASVDVVIQVVSGAGTTIENYGEITSDQTGPAYANEATYINVPSTTIHPMPLFSDILAMLPIGILAGVIVIRQRRKVNN